MRPGRCSFQDCRLTGLDYLPVVVPPGFEPGSSAPKAEVLDRYTTGLFMVGLRGFEPLSTRLKGGFSNLSEIQAQWCVRVGFSPTTVPLIVWAALSKLSDTCGGLARIRTAVCCSQGNGATRLHYEPMLKVTDRYLVAVRFGSSPSVFNGKGGWT